MVLKDGRSGIVDGCSRVFNGRSGAQESSRATLAPSCNQNLHCFSMDRGSGVVDSDSRVVDGGSGVVNVLRSRDVGRSPKIRCHTEVSCWRPGGRGIIVFHFNSFLT